MSILKFLFRHTLNSVPFGIGLMVLIGLYIGLGSGFASFREWLEMDELLFFSWWPLKVLMVLLVANLSTVTVVRIPLTPPRYGVWAIHLGIILLIISTSAYYSRKVEGLTRIWKGQTVQEFYDRWERALYVSVIGERRLPRAMTPMPSLPRFHEYSPANRNADYLRRGELRDLPVAMAIPNAQSQTGYAAGTLNDAMGLPPSALRMSVVGYYPYAEIKSTWTTNREEGMPGLWISESDMPSATNPDPSWGPERGLAGWDPHPPLTNVIGKAHVQHRHLPHQQDVDALVAEAAQLHRFSIRVGDSFQQELSFEPGQVIKLGNTGYTIAFQAFQPDWPSMDHGIVPAVTLLITRDGPEPFVFRRMVLSEWNSQTDFLLNIPGKGPMGARQTKVVDDQIDIQYLFSDPDNLFPSEAANARHLLLTSGDNDRVTHVVVDGTDFSRTEVMENGQGTIVVDARQSTLADPTLQWTRFAGHAVLWPTSSKVVTQSLLKVRREPFLMLDQEAVTVPKEKRDRNQAASGAAQVIVVRLKSGQWTKDVPVPFAQFAMQVVPLTPPIVVPGSKARLQFTLGTTARPMPMTVRLDNFTAVPYGGVDVKQSEIFRDFISGIHITDRHTGKSWDGKAQLNEPQFVPGGVMPWPFDESWLVYQAQWDPDGQKYTVLGVGNRPAVGVMVISCVIIAGGLLYAFYLKPVIVRRMKRIAIEKAAARRPKKHTPEEAMVANV